MQKKIEIRNDKASSVACVTTRLRGQNEKLTQPETGEGTGAPKKPLTERDVLWRNSIKIGTADAARATKFA